MSHIFPESSLEPSYLLTIDELIALENVETPEYVTVSVNEEFIDHTLFKSHILKEGDEVEFLYFMGGGQ